MHWIKVHWTLALCFIPLGVGQAMDARAADMTKTLHVAFANAEGGFDPQASNDTTTSGAVIVGNVCYPRTHQS